MRSGARWIAIVAGVALVVALVLLARGGEPREDDAQSDSAASGFVEPRTAATAADREAVATSRIELAAKAAGGTAALTVLLRSADGAAVSGARVVATRTRRTQEAPWGPVAISDAEGRARFTALEPGAWIVTLQGMAWRSVTLEPGSDVTIEITVDERGRVEGIVVDESGTPLPGAAILVVESQEDDGREVAVSGSDGRFAFDTVALDSVCTARLAGYAPAVPMHVLVFGSEAASITLALARGDCRVHGIVLDEGLRPVPDAWLCAASHDDRTTRTRSGADGRFALRDLPVGEIRVVARQTAHGTGEIVVRLLPGETAVIDLRLLSRVVVAGRVTTTEQRAIAGARLVLVSKDARHTWSTLSDADGGFLVRGLPVGRTSVRITHADHAPAHEEVVLVEDQPSMRFDFVLPTTTTIGGQVVDEQDAPLADLVVATADWADAVITGADGGFALRVANPGEALEVYTSSSVTRPIARMHDVDPRAGDLRIVIPIEAWPSAFVTATAMRPPGWEDETLRVALYDSDGDSPVLIHGVARAGALRIGPLPPGSYSLCTTGIRSRFHADELARFALAPHQHLELGVIQVPAPVVPELRSRTGDGRVITELRGRFVEGGDHREAIPVGLHEGHTTWQPPLRAGEYRLIVDDGEGYRGTEQLVTLRAGPPNVIELVLTAR